MKLNTRLTIALFATALLLSGLAHAQNVQMRTGVHANYSRLVVDWPSKAKSTVKQQGQTLTITFDKAANPQTGQVKTSKTRNIKDVKIAKTDPLTVTLTIPENSRHRNFYAGNRFVLDVYNPPGSKPTPIPQKTTPPVAAKTPDKTTKTAKVAKVEPVEKEELTAPSNAATDAKTDITKTADDKPEDEPKSEPPPYGKIENPGLKSASLIALSSSNTFGLAVFERDEQIYIVNDNPDLLISPKISGEDSKYLMPLEKIEKDDAIIFTAQSIIGNFVRAQGGGLLWKIIVSGAKTKAKPVEPIRLDVDEDVIHSGRLLVPFKEPNKVIEVKDPVTGLYLKVVTSKTSSDFTGERRSFPEFDLLSSAAGLVVLPRVDDLEVKVTRDGVLIRRPRGLAILSEDRINKNETLRVISDNKQPEDVKRIFDFKNWQLGGIEAARENQNILLSNAAQLPKTERDAAFMSLAKMYLANAMGAEALGFLHMLENDNPGIANTAEFRAIRGAARAIDYKTEEAFTDMAIKELEEFEEIGFWKAYALADIGDWQQAVSVLPKSALILYEYPDLLVNRIGLVAIEVALRAGNTHLATDIIEILRSEYETLTQEQIAALKYLQGEAARQKGDIEATKKYWQPLIRGRDDLYRAKAGLALTRLKIDEGELEPKDAVDSLERLRYAWRGDELEARIGYWLGRTYFEARQFVKGLNLMREAATVAAGTNLGKRITDEMTDIFTGLYLGDALDTVSPLDAVALYEQFSELVPSGETGDKIVERLADRLTTADLLGRASNLLAYQLNHRLQGIEAYNVAVKLAAIYLLDARAQDALKVLDKAQTHFEKLPEDMKTADKIQDMTLLRARALSRNGRPDQGIKMLENLNNNPTTNRLRADIAWTAGYWDDAASALGDVITDQNISLTRPLSDDHTTLLLHRAISLNLASDRIGLANMREKYTDAMAQTDKARIFEVITRPRQNSALADRETLMGIVSEVDLFSDFLESYKAVTKPSN